MYERIFLSSCLYVYVYMYMYVCMYVCMYAYVCNLKKINCTSQKSMCASKYKYTEIDHILVVKINYNLNYLSIIPYGTLEKFLN